MYQPEFPIHPQFTKAKGRSPRDAASLGRKGRHPDKNFNFMGEEVYDSNDNWSHSVSGLPLQEERDQQGGLMAKKAFANLTDLVNRQEATSRSRDIPQEPKVIDMFLGSEEEEKEGEEDEDEDEDVRRPPEGAEINSPEQEKNDSQEQGKERGNLASSCLEDSGYASNSLSIDRPDNGAINTWKTAPIAAEDWAGEAELWGPHVAAENSSNSETFPELAEAFWNLQEKEKFKEWEKQKHHIHLVMYRRLALLRWIRSLQQKVVDQQSRLQDSFDTILDNRKELIRCVQQGRAGTKEL